MECFEKESRRDRHQYCTGGFDPNDVVISGIAGRFPECNSVGELQEALFTKKDLQIFRNDRFEKGNLGMPFSSRGLVKNIDKFDADFFGFPYDKANNMGPTARIALEVTYEAIADAGYDPYSLRGANIGIYNGSIYNDKLNLACNDSEDLPCHYWSKSMNAHHLSYAFDFTGPSFSLDVGCSTSAVGILAALDDVMKDRVDAAIVSSTQLNLCPTFSALYIAWGISSPTGISIPFDESSKGMNRAESVSSIFIQKASFARRAYVKILGGENHSAGHNPDGISVPFLPMQIEFIQKLLQNTGVDINDVDFVETHGTGTVVGDPIELNAVSRSFSVEKRTKPMYVGSIKSSIGHTEAGSGASGVIKAIICCETGLIPPHQCLGVLNSKCKELLEGKVKVVTETVPLTSPYILVNSFGLGGTLVHLLVQQNPNTLISNRITNKLPKIVLYSATTESAVEFVFEYIKNNLDLPEEFFCLLHKLSFSPTHLKPFRGYALFEDKHEPVVNIKLACPAKKEIWFIYNGLGSAWPGMGLHLMEIDIFAESMKKSAATLKPFGYDLFEILNPNKNLLKTDWRILPALLGIVSLEIALTDVLQEMDIRPDGIVGHGIGEIVAAYADGCITAEETVLIAYWIGTVFENANLPRGALATVGLGWKKALELCPKNVFPACHNTDDSIMIAGYENDIHNFVEKLKSENISAHTEDCYGHCMHCPSAKKVVPKLTKHLNGVLKKSKTRSEKWICTSYLESEWESLKVKNPGPEYFVNNVISPVYFKEATAKIPVDAITIEVGSHCLLQSMLKRNIGLLSTNICVMQKNDNNNLKLFFDSIGQLYIEGFQPKVEMLYPPIKFPVPRNTPRISDLIKWNHSISYNVPKWDTKQKLISHHFSLDNNDRYLMDHLIDGRSMFPTAGYIFLAWNALASKLKLELPEIPIMIENLKIYRPVIMNSLHSLKFDCNILNDSGHFEITYGDSLMAVGQIYELKNVAFREPEPVYKYNSNSAITGADIYNELKMSGYEYGPAFQGLTEVNMNGTEGLVLWMNKWIPFFDSLLLFFGMMSDSEAFHLPTGLISFKFDPNIFHQQLDTLKNNKNRGIPVNYNPSTKTCRSIGAEITGVISDPEPCQVKCVQPTLEEYKFVPYLCKHSPEKDFKLQLHRYMSVCNELICIIGKKLKLDVEKYKFSIDESGLTAKDHSPELPENQSLLKCLKEVSGVSMDSQIRKECLTYVKTIGTEILNSTMTDEYTLKIVLEIVAENSIGEVNIVELNNFNFPIVLQNATKIVKKYCHLKCKSSVLVAPEEVKVDQKELSREGIQLSSESALASLSKDKDQDFVIGSYMGGSENELRSLVNMLSSIVKPTGFILFYFKDEMLPAEKLLVNLSGEVYLTQPASVLKKVFQENSLIPISKMGSYGVTLYLLRPSTATNPYKVLTIQDDNNFLWVEDLKKELCSNNSYTLWLVAEDSESNGILGLVNCLKQEPGGDRIRCVLLPSAQKNSRPSFSFKNSFYKPLLTKNLVMNVWKNGTWGSYRYHLLKNNKELKKVEHSYVSCRKYDDLSSFEWVESFVKYSEETSKLIHIYYSAINFKDIVEVTGKLLDETSKSITNKVDGSRLGFEFSGRDPQGRRVAGIVDGTGLATSTIVDPMLLIDVPDYWSLEDAATVPVVYATSYYALIARAQLKKGEKILIHSGTSGIGIAAINIALSLQCEVFTTVGNEEKVNFLQKLFPQIKKENIGSSKNTTFESMIKRQTKGKGVDVVLNFLSDDEFQASVNCIAKHGRFVEMNKYNLPLDKSLGLRVFLENITFHGVFLDQLFENTSSAKETLCHVMQLVREGIKCHVVKPLNRNVFNINEVEQAFKHMTNGIHVAKVLLKIRDEESYRKAIPRLLSLPAVPNTYFDPAKVYIVIGCLSGFEIEVTKWILSRGGRNIILASRYGSRVPYHNLCLQKWRKLGANIKISTLDASKRSEAELLLRETVKIGPLGGVFNCAAVLEDALIGSQNPKKYKKVSAQKAEASKHLDALTRKMCPSLDYFVCFSSIISGRGNAGQTNYGYANSAMERICEQRRDDGLHGLAIQWGNIRDVGPAHNVVIPGVGTQSARSCIETLDIFCQTKCAVASSYIAAGETKKCDQFQAGTKFPKSLASQQGNKSVSKVLPFISTNGIDPAPALSCNDLLLNNIKKSMLTPSFIIHVGQTDVEDSDLLLEYSNHPVYAILWTNSVTMKDIEFITIWYRKLIQSKVYCPFHLIGYCLDNSSTLEISALIEGTITPEKPIIIMYATSNLNYTLSKEEIHKDRKISILCNFVTQFSYEKFQEVKVKLKSKRRLDQKYDDFLKFLTASCSETADTIKMFDVVSGYIKASQISKSFILKNELSGDVSEENLHSGKVVVHRLKPKKKLIYNNVLDLPAQYRFFH